MASNSAPAATPRSGIELLTGSTQDADKLPGLRDILNETAIALAQALLPSTASRLDMVLLAIQTGKAGDVLSTHAESVASAAIKSAQWDGPILIGVDRAFVLSLVDTLFGGDGSEPPYRTERPLTKLETSIVKWLFEQVNRSLQASFKRLADISLTLERIDNPPAFDCLGRPSSTVAAATFELKCSGGVGRMFIALPQPVLGFLKSAPARQAPVQTTALDPGWSRSLGNRIGRAGLSMKAILGATQLRLGEVAALRPGQIIALDAISQNRVRLDCNGQPLYWCKLGQADGVYTLSIEREIDQEQEFMDDILSH